MINTKAKKYTLKKYDNSENQSETLDFVVSTRCLIMLITFTD